MQFAERWLGIGSFVVALAGIGTLAVQLRPHHHQLQHHHRAVDTVRFENPGCSGVAAARTPASTDTTDTIDEALLRGDDLYADVLAKADVARCLTTSPKLEMLIEIAADGRVTNVSHRPERPTAESRCLAKVVRGLRFPASTSGVTLRNVFNR